MQDAKKEMRKVGSRGQMWTSLMVGVFVLAAVGILHIILDQAYTHSLRPKAIRMGVDADNLELIDIAWEMFNIPVLLAFAWGMINSGRQSRRSTYEL